MGLSFNQLSDRWRFRLTSFAGADFRRLLQRVGVSYVDVKLTSTQMDTLNATPVELVPAPGTGKVLECLGVFAYNAVGSTPFELGSGTLDVRYENSSGGLAAQFTNAFVESAAAAYFKAVARDVVALANKALVAYASADVTAGNGTIYLRVYYRTVVVAEVNPAVG